MTGSTKYKFFSFKVILLLALNLIFTIRISPQRLNEYSFFNFSSTNELSQNFINDLHQDKTGFLWIATKDGLNRYDGYNVEIFRHSRRDANSIAGNYINCIFEDSNGFLWFGTSTGLSRFDPVSSTFNNFLSSPNDSLSLSNSNVNAVCEDVRHRIWVGTTEGLNLLDSTSHTFSKFYRTKDVSKGLLHNNVRLLQADKNEGIWLGYDTDGLSYINPIEKKFDHFSSENYPDFIPDQIIKSIYDDGKGNIFVTGSWNIFLKIEKSGMKLHNLYNAKIVRSINNFITESSDSTIFIVNDRKISMLDLNTMSKTDLIDEEYKFPHTFSINSLTRTTDGVLWIGTNGYGLYKLVPKRKNFKSILFPSSNGHGLTIRSVRTIYEDSDGDLWIGGYSSLNVIRNFSSYNSSTNPENLHVEEIRSLKNKNIYTIIEDPVDRNILWIGTEFYGLFKYDKINDKSIRIDLLPEYRGLIKGDQFFNIIADKNKNIWIATDAEILKFTYNVLKPERYNFGEKNPAEKNYSQYVTLFEDDNGRIWIGTKGNGIIVLNPSDMEYFRLQHNPDDENSLTSNSILFINEDRQGSIWIGTPMGLNKYNKKQKFIVSYTKEDGLKNDCIYAVYQDKQGIFWMSSNNGISRYNPSKNTFENYDRSYGLQNNEFNFAAHFKDKNGIVFFGGISGITYFDPESVRYNNYIPNFAIVKFQKFNKETKLDKSITYTDQLHLSYKDYIFSIELTSFDFSYPQLNRFAYKLEGLDSNWNYVDEKRRIISFTGLNPGDYVFKYKAANSDGIWNNNYRTLNIFISPPFWQTWWFRTFIILTLVIIMLIFYRNRIKNLENERNRQIDFSKKLIDKQEEERERIAGELHDDIGQSVIIANNKLRLGLYSSDIKKSMEYFRSASENMDNLSDQISSISHNLHPQELAQLGPTLAIESMVERISESSEVSFTVNIQNIDNKLSKEDEINLFRIIQEGINNIIKHSKAVNAYVNITSYPDKIVCEIRDNGKGYDASSVNSCQSARPHFGITSMRERAQLINGEVIFDSKINQGTSVKIIINLK